MLGVRPGCSKLFVRSAGIGRTAQKRNLADVQQLPPVVAPFIQYCSDCNITHGIQASMELMHSTGLPWVGAFVATGLGLRLATAPFHVYAEKLFAKRIHVYNYFNSEILRRVAKTHNLKIVPDAEQKRLLIGGNEELTKKANQLAEDAVIKYVMDNSLTSSRIQSLKISTVPLWIFSSFAIRNIISNDFAPALDGFLWINDFLTPDPYFILPVTVGLFSFLNLYSQRMVFSRPQTWTTKFYDGFLGAFTLAAVVIMIKLPACIPLYWLTVSVSGFAQSLILRHPKMKELFGIPKLPTDSRQPLRDLFFLRKKQIL